MLIALERDVPNMLLNCRIKPVTVTAIAFIPAWRNSKIAPLTALSQV